MPACRFGSTFPRNLRAINLWKSEIVKSQTVTLGVISGLADLLASHRSMDTPATALSRPLRPLWEIMHVVEQE